MRRRRPWLQWLLVATLIGIGPGAQASEESELLVAKGQVAYHRGRFTQAKALLEQAVAADGEDPDARYMLGVTLNALGDFSEAIPQLERAAALKPGVPATEYALEVARARAAGRPAPLAPRAEEVAPVDEVTRARRPELYKPWEFHAATGLMYDDNVTLTHEKNDDGAVTFSVGGRLDVFTRANALVRLEYDMFNRWYFDIDEFDFQSHRIRGTGSYGVTERIWAGVQGGADFFRLDDHGYLNEPFVFPFVSYNWEGRGLTQATYRYGHGTYLQPPFENRRDGSNQLVGLTHTFYWAGGRYLTLGYAYGREDPSEKFVRMLDAEGQGVCEGNGQSSAPCPRDFRFHFNEVSLSLGFEAWWNMLFDLVYYYRYNEYEQPNSLSDFRTRRYDNEHQIFAQVLRPITKNFRVALRYFGTFNPSNIEVYDYDRNRVWGVLEVVY